MNHSVATTSTFPGRAASQAAPFCEAKLQESVPALSPPAASPSAAVSADGMYHREDSPPIEPPALEDSRLYYLARGVAVESPPNTPSFVEAYTTTTPGVVVAYATTEPALDQDSPSPPPSSQQSPQTPYTPFHEEHVPAYAAGHYAAQPWIGNVGIGLATSGAGTHAQGPVDSTTLEMAPVPAMQYHPCAPTSPEGRGHIQKPWSPQSMLTHLPSLRHASHDHFQVHGRGGGGGESYPAARGDSYPQYVYVQTSQQEGYLAYAAPVPVNVEVEEREREAPQLSIYQPQPQPCFHPQCFASYGWHSTTGEPALVQWR
ncbi:hypothetical protein B0H11DRAFT_2389272 [Mycena galericulata]|nr:hypothetical protein B0H11DRAFT_2389272 [Mycena galericulata]